MFFEIIKFFSKRDIQINQKLRNNLQFYKKNPFKNESDQYSTSRSIVYKKSL